MANRDAIDLAMMIDGRGVIPAAAHAMHRGAYGDAVDRALVAATDLLRDRDRLLRCPASLGMDASRAPRIAAALQRAVP